MTPSDSPPPPAPVQPHHPGEAPVEARGRAPAQATSPVNVALILASIGVTLYIFRGEEAVHAQNAARFQAFAISAWPQGWAGFFPAFLPEIRHGEWWRLWTPMFIHFGIMHLGFNMMGMYNLGGPLERVKGTPGYLLLCLVLGLLSNLGQYLVAGPNFGGMSGVLYGLFGYIWLRARFDRRFPLEIPKQTLGIALVWFFLCFTGLLGPIGNASHTVGLVIGALWGAGEGWWVTNREGHPSGIHADGSV